METVTLSKVHTEKLYKKIPHPLRMRKSDCTDVELKPRANHQCPQLTYQCIQQLSLHQFGPRRMNGVIVGDFKPQQLLSL